MTGCLLRWSSRIRMMLKHMAQTSLKKVLRIEHSYDMLKQVINCQKGRCSMRGRLKKVRRCCVAVVSIMTMLFLSAMTAAEETVPFVFAFTEKTSYVNVGKTKTLEYTIPEGEKVVRWKVSNKKIARINNNGEHHIFQNGRKLFRPFVL